MSKFNFQNFVSEFRISDLPIDCNRNHEHRIILLNAYDVDLYQSWTIELQEKLSKLNDSNLITVDIGLNFFHLQRSALSELRVTLIRKTFLLTKLFLPRYRIKYNFVSPRINFAPHVMRSFKITRNILRTGLTQNSFANASHRERSIFSTLATKFGTVEFELNRRWLLLFNLVLGYELAFAKTQRLIKAIEPCVIITGNGRLIKPAAIVSAGRQNNIQTVIVERGAFPGTFDLYRVSPHSISERRAQALKLLNKFGSLKSAEIANEYIELRKLYDPISGLRWQRNFEEGSLPNLNGKKICVCYTSTEIEFAVFGDFQPKEEFQNQEEAFRALADSLDPQEWQVVIRRHPYGSDVVQVDPEKRLWKALSLYPHVTFVSPHEKIDSYALARNADLIAHFNSSMGPESISLGVAPVITMGPTMWEASDSEYVVNTKEKLSKLLKSRIEIRPQSDITLWGLYWATFGFRFSKVEWSSNKGYVYGRRII